MEPIRYIGDAYGQTVMAGASWDLLWLFAGLPALFVIAHLLYCRIRKPRGK